MSRFALWLSFTIACGRVGFDPAPSRDEPRVDGFAGDGVPGDGVLGDGTSADVPSGTCEFATAGCGRDEILCCQGAFDMCIPYFQSCTGTVSTCDVSTQAGCNTASGELCCQGGGPYPHCMSPPTC